MTGKCSLMSTFLNQNDKYEILLILNYKETAQNAFLKWYIQAIGLSKT